jgi:hypothetical protein
MMERQMELRFKGERDYLQGADIFNETVRWLIAKEGEIMNIDFTFHKLASQQLKAIVGTRPDGAKPVAECVFTSSGTRQRAYVVEIDQPVTDRYPYPEDEIVSLMEIDLAKRRGVLSGEARYSDIEIWVAMTKALHYKVFPDLKGKWLFVRGRFPQYANHGRATEHAVAIVASFNDKLTRSEVLVDGVKVGEIYFSIV